MCTIHMSKKIMDTCPQREYFVVGVWRDHVLKPIRAAENTLDAEYEEVIAERKAFERFRDRVAAVDTVSPTLSSSQRPGHRLDTGGGQRKRVRTAFRETVMSTEHYESAHGETLKKHAVGELSADIAATLCRETSTPFTTVEKESLLTCIERSVELRRQYGDQLRDERDSLETSRESLGDLLAACEAPSIPDWYRSDFESEVDAVSRARQRIVHRRNPVSGKDGHDLCQYLYQDHEWTYPVLTAVTRLHDTTL